MNFEYVNYWKACVKEGVNNPPALKNMPANWLWVDFVLVDTYFRVGLHRSHYALRII